FVGKSLLHGDVLMWLMKTLLTSRCINQWGAGHGITNKPMSAMSEERPFGVFTAGGNFTYTAVLGLTGTDQDIKLPVRSLH
ncbi:hypothetical protein ACVWWU_001627, partial [Pantoea sp. PA1]